MAMPAALRRYWANKRGHKKARRARRSSSRALVRHVHHYPKKHRGGRRRRGGGGTSLGLIPVTLLAAGLGYAGNVSAFVDVLKKVPGTKTFGMPLIVGGIALGVNEWIYPNKWLRLAGLLGIAIGAFQLGTKKFDADWVGDVGDPDGFMADVR